MLGSAWRQVDPLGFFPSLSTKAYSPSSLSDAPLPSPCSLFGLLIASHVIRGVLGAPMKELLYVPDIQQGRSTSADRLAAAKRLARQQRRDLSGKQQGQEGQQREAGAAAAAAARRGEVAAAALTEEEVEERRQQQQLRRRQQQEESKRAKQRARGLQEQQRAVEARGHPSSSQDRPTEVEGREQPSGPSKAHHESEPESDSIRSSETLSHSDLMHEQGTSSSGPPEQDTALPDELFLFGTGI